MFNNFKMRRKSATTKKIETSDDSPRIGEFLRYLRGKFRLTQEFIAEKIGVSRPTLNKIEADKANLSLLQAKKLADFYNIPINNLLIGKDSISADARRNLSTSSTLLPESTSGITEELPTNRYRQNIKEETTLYICTKLMAEPLFFEPSLKYVLFLVEIAAIEKLESPLLGFEYTKSAQGPEPKDWHNFINNLISLKSLSRVNVPPHKYPYLKLLALRQPRLENFKANEIVLIDEVITSIKSLDEQGVQKYTSNIRCYKDAEMYQKIKLY